MTGRARHPNACRTKPYDHRTRSRRNPRSRRPRCPLRTEWPATDDRRGFFDASRGCGHRGDRHVVPFAAGLFVFFDPLRRSRAGLGFIRVATLDALPDDGMPRRFRSLPAARDAWNFFPNEPIGAVFLRRQKGQATPEAFQTTCPHAGCLVDFVAANKIFKCPCHNSPFQLDGEIIQPSPSPRPMDTLECKVVDERGVKRCGSSSRIFTPASPRRWRRHETAQLARSSHRLPRTSCTRRCYERIPGGARWRYVWGSTLVFAFSVQVITGIFLWMSYSPSAQTAWESVYFIQYQMQGGWLLRGLHHFTAQAMVVLLALHLMQVVIDGAYRAPREVNFWLGLILMQIVLGLSLTGYLLPWDQKGYWATRVATNLMSLVPLGGCQELVVGGPDYGHHTLTRFFALHAGVLPGLLVGFLVLHVALFRRHGICHKQPAKRARCDVLARPGAQGRRGLPGGAGRCAVSDRAAGTAGLAGRSGLAGQRPNLGAELGAPADPAHAYSAAPARVVFLVLVSVSSSCSRVAARRESSSARSSIPGLVMLLLFLMPIFGRWKLGHRFNIAFTLLLLVGIGWLTAAAYIEDHRAKWTDPEKFAETEKQVREMGRSGKTVEQFFGGDQTEDR